MPSTRPSEKASGSGQAGAALLGSSCSGELGTDFGTAGQWWAGGVAVLGVAGPCLLREHWG